ncbi:MAG: hypothetical protein GY943_20265, partial [Chloroflexi bacterium]|nr:hypothetical protein [Chloroflexota bacterium]
DRKSVGQGKSVERGGLRISKKKTHRTKTAVYALSLQLSSLGFRQKPLSLTHMGTTGTVLLWVRLWR